jgi:S-adenosylmethionine:tRNA ribosyltransferase-isomerase
LSETPLLLDHFDFSLPSELIAQFPSPHREDARLLVLQRASGALQSAGFPDIVEYFRAGDLLVLNDTRVVPARLLGRKDSGGRIEVFLVRRLFGEAEEWACLTRSSKPPRAGSRIEFGDDLQGLVLEGGEPPFRHLRFACAGDFFQKLEEVGRIPLPPYIRRDDTPLDRVRYQTVFASTPGAVAAPTAGLHFTGDILERLRQRGVEVRTLTLHVGLGTFLPVRSENLLQHRMHGEVFCIPQATADAVNRAKKEGRRVFAVGTTTTRALEHVARNDGFITAGEGVTELFIYPGFPFKVIDALITNFHLPRSTLLVLVAAFAGRDTILEAYRLAVAEGFRFFSYGDCMLIV